MKISGPWMHRIAQVMRTPEAARFWWASRNPRRYQERRLLELLRENQDTAYGRAHGFGEIDGLEAYRERVPLISAKELAPWVDRMKAGERRVLTEEDPVFYGRSTGTTGRPKEIPINETYRSDFQRSVMVAMWFAYWRVPEAFQHKLLYFVSPRAEDETEEGIEIGAISGYNFTQMPEEVRSLYAWPYELIEVEDLETRWYMALHIAAQEKISLIAGIFPVGLLMMLRKLDERALELAEHLDAGTWPGWLKLTQAQVMRFEKWRRAAPQAAARMRRAAHAEVNERVGLVWPELRAVFCWKAASASLYVGELEARLGERVQVFDTVYSATEGWCTSPMAEAGLGGPLTVTGHVYEFLEEEVVEAAGGDVAKLKHAPTKLVDELESGKRYYIVLSTTAGLYRYFLGDLLEVCGWWGRVPKLVFVRKYGASYNLVGEKLVESHVTDGVAEALGAVGREAVWFSMVPVYEASGAPRYELWVEFVDGEREGLEAFAEAVRAGMCRANDDWRAYREDGTLGALMVRQVRSGAYEEVLVRWEREGRSLGQLKNSHLVGERGRLPCGEEEVWGEV